MPKTTVNLQDSFLNQVRRDNTPVRLTLLDGASIDGHVKGFDNFTVHMKSEKSNHLIYKHAIAQIITSVETPSPSDKPRKPDSSASEKPRGEAFNTLDLAQVSVPSAES